MTRRLLLLDLGAYLTLARTEARAAQETRSEKVVNVGDTRVRILVAEVASKGSRSFIYFHPHENEHGSAVVTRHTIRQFGGRFIEIRSAGERFISFRLKGVNYSFDPNRMFTDAGLESSLAHFAPISEGAFECARELRKAVLSLLGNGTTPIVGVHNNSEGSLSVSSYKKGGMLETQAAKVATNSQERPNDYFLVLNEKLFSRLHHAGFNVVLRAPDAPDDGSLSVFCQQNHWPYVHVEAAESDMSHQEKMLGALSAAIA